LHVGVDLVEVDCGEVQRTLATELQKELALLLGLT
jgi:hypothetical protein